MSNDNNTNTYLPPFPMDDEDETTTLQPSDPMPVTVTVPTVTGPTATVDFERYMQLHAEYVRTKEENLRLRRKVIQLEETLKQKATKKAKLQGEDLKNAIVDIILNSSLNVESIPDEVERELYSFVLTQISAAAGTASWIRKLFTCS